MTERADDFVAQLIALLARCTGGLEEQLAVVIEEQIREEFGSQEVYIHRAGWLDRAQRDESIRAEKRAGRSFGAIAMKYGISRVRAKQICDREEP